MIKANIILDDLKWKKKIKNHQIYFNNKFKKLSKSKFIKKSHQFTILLTNDKFMKKLNYKFRKKNKSTDVLSFPFNQKVNNNTYLGDIAIGYEIINKRSIKTNFKLELDKMWIHGLLHLLGYKHSKIKDYNKMNKLEKLILNYFYKLN